jgi:Nickel responsive protein SCO4226-like
MKRGGGGFKGYGNGGPDTLWRPTWIERRIDMPVFMVERDLKGIRTVRYIRSTFVPGEARCMCLFEAPTEQNVRDLNDRAKIPYTRVVEALDLTP